MLTKQFIELFDALVKRIQAIIAREKEENRMNSDQMLNKKDRACHAVHFPRIPAQLNHLCLRGYQLRKQLKSSALQSANLKRFQVEEAMGIRASQCNSVQKNCLCITNSATELEGARVVYWRFKERSLAARKLRKTECSPNCSVKELSYKHQITSLSHPSLVKSSEENLDYWEEMLKAKEERQFQLDKVTKYLS